jgi:hypothetical protein
MSQPLTLKIDEWNPENVRYMQPRVSDRGAKSVSIISNQTNRSLHITTPKMMTWGISDYVDEQGVSDGRFTMSLVFPSEDYKTPETTVFLDKLKEFENKVLDDAVTNSETWFGEEMSREVAKHTFFPFLKYSKDKNTKKIDYSKSPSIRAKVPNYNGKWAVELYDTNHNCIFPSDNDNITPVDMVPKKSNCACVLQCGGLWFGGKGWGLTWKLIQAVVKPPQVVSIFGKCHIDLTPEDAEAINKEVVSQVDEEVEEKLVEGLKPLVRQSAQGDTTVEDSDEEVEVPVPSPVVEAVSEPVKKKRVVKKVKKTAVEESA